MNIERGGVTETWRSSNFSRQMYKNNVVLDFVQLMKSRILPGFHSALLVLLKRRLDPQHSNRAAGLLILAAEEVQINNHQRLVLGCYVCQKGIHSSSSCSFFMLLLHLYTTNHFVWSNFTRKLWTVCQNPSWLCHLFIDFFCCCLFSPRLLIYSFICVWTVVEYFGFISIKIPDELGVELDESQVPQGAET